MKDILIKTISIIIIGSQIFYEDIFLAEQQKIDRNILSYKYDVSTNQIYESYNDLTHNLSYVDDTVFEDIEKIFADVEWYTDFDLGAPQKYDLYLSKYAELVLLKQPYKDIENQTTQMLDELMKTLDAGDVLSAHMENYIYYVYDYDGDGRVELCIKDLGSIFVFQYEESENCIYLIDSLGGNVVLGGTGTQYAFGGNTDQLLKIESYGEGIKRREEFTFYLCEGEEYFLKLPSFVYRDHDFLITDRMKDQSGLFIEGAEARYYFKITKEQYDRLISYYSDALDKAYRKQEDVKYQYDEIIKEFKND